MCRVSIDSQVTTPTVRESTRTHFDCPTAAGAPLEGNGGQATSGSHWEAAIFQSEIMIGASAGIQRRAVSPMTLGLAQDSGWYEPNWDAVGFLRHGHKAGCEMLVRPPLLSNAHAFAKACCLHGRLLAALVAHMIPPSASFDGPEQSMFVQW